MHIHRFFMAQTIGSGALNISSVIIQSTCTNLETLIKPLTNLDNIFSHNVDASNIIFDDPKDVSILKYLFSSALPNQTFIGNQYIWNVFQAYINQKDNITIDIQQLDEHCKNKNLLRLILTDLAKIGEDDKYLEENYKNKNMLMPEVLSIFKHLEWIDIECNGYPLSFESLLSVIRDKKIDSVRIEDDHIWLSEAQLYVNQYDKADLMITRDGHHVSIGRKWI